MLPAKVNTATIQKIPIAIPNTDKALLNLFPFKKVLLNEKALTIKLIIFFNIILQFAYKKNTICYNYWYHSINKAINPLYILFDSVRK